ncbi:MAG TPA: threonine synthase [Acidimicrobiia bacterium]
MPGGDINYVSTRGFAEPRSFADVVLEGAAPDGGLYVPETLPTFHDPDGDAHAPFMVAALEAFGARDVEDLVQSAMSSFNHPDIAPIREVGPFLVMEMFWGPTLSFKDHALQVLGGLIDRYLAEAGEHRTVLVATSGDTGSAAIEAFRGLESVEIVVLFPEGLVTEFQKRQMTTVSDANVSVIGVLGDFDVCQRLVKEAFRNPGLASANSINWGRVAAQVGYYMSASARIDQPFDVVVPTGNFGNAYSAFLSRAMRSKIGEITVATNANRVLADLHETGRVASRSTVPTLAPAMDIQVPSNLERYMYNHEVTDFAGHFGAGWASDEKVLETIARVYEGFGYLIDPHTAVAWAVAEDLDPSDVPRLIVSTAHPAKFAEAIEQAVGFVPEVPEWARFDPDGPEHVTTIGPNVEELLALLPD